MSVLSRLYTIAPETHSLDPEVVNSTIEIASEQVGSVFGKHAELATAYLVAHMLTMSARQGAGGPIISETEGELSRSYASPLSGVSTTNLSSLSASGYGQEFMRIRRMCVFSPRTQGV